MEAKTILHLLEEQAVSLQHRPALWHKENGRYVATSWNEYAQRVRQIAYGLNLNGFRSGEVLGILGFNREEWLVADLAAMALGGVPVGLYTNSSDEQIAYVLGHCEATVVLVENRKYLERLLALWPQLPTVRKVVLMEGTAPTEPNVILYEALLREGTRAPASWYRQALERLEPDQLATLIYTSGTTGHPKGVMLTHRNLTWTARQLATAAEVDHRDSLVSYLPLSHIAEQLLSLHCPITLGYQVFFAESLERLPVNLKEVRPTAFFGVPRVWEKFKAKLEEGIAQEPPLKQRILKEARERTLRRHGLVLRGLRAHKSLELPYQVASRSLFHLLKKKIGLERTRIFGTAAAPIGKDVLEFFASMDIIIQEVYGQSEVTGPTSVNAPGAIHLGTLGRPMIGVEVRIAEDGEILVRGANVCAGYYKNPKATAELLEDGWLHSGDLGALDDEGFLTIHGRKKEIIVTSGGKKTDPASIEALLKSLPPLGNAMVVGEGRNFLVALLPLDPEKVPAYAKEHGLPSDPVQLAKQPRFLQDLERRIESQVNKKLSRFETIKRFAVLPYDFQVETGELTPTLKLRRGPTEKKYQAVIDELYREAKPERLSRAS